MATSWRKSLISRSDVYHLLVKDMGSCGVGPGCGVGGCGVGGGVGGWWGGVGGGGGREIAGQELCRAIFNGALAVGFLVLGSQQVPSLSRLLKEHIINI